MTTHPTRLWHDGRRGVARHAGVEIELAGVPQLLPGVRVVEIDYAPSTRLCRIRPSGGCWREASRDQVERLQAWLDRIAAAARAVVDATPTGARVALTVAG